MGWYLAEALVEKSSGLPFHPGWSLFRVQEYWLEVTQKAKGGHRQCQSELLLPVVRQDSEARISHPTDRTLWSSYCCLCLIPSLSPHPLPKILENIRYGNNIGRIFILFIQNYI